MNDKVIEGQSMEIGDVLNRSGGLDIGSDQSPVDDLLTFTSPTQSDPAKTQENLKDQFDKSNSANDVALDSKLKTEASLVSTDWKPRKWSRSGSLSSRGSGFSHSSNVKIPDSAEPKTEMPPHNATPLRSRSGDAAACATVSAVSSEDTGSRKKPRLGWGQGLAKFEKKKVEGPDDDSATKPGFVVCVSGEPSHVNNHADKSPRLAGFLECASPATLYSSANDSVPGNVRPGPWRYHTADTPTTPYARPLGRFTKLALKLINPVFQWFISSVSILEFVVNQESRVSFQETVIPSPAIDQGPALSNRDEQGVFGKQALEKDSGKQIKISGNGGLSELELMLKQKTFTRSEIDRLTELLHSRTVESSHGDWEKNTEFLPPLSVSGSRGKDNFTRSSLQETRKESHLDNRRFDGRVSTVVVSSKVLEEDVATPTELAKAYMGNRSSKVSPSVLGLQSPVMSLVQKPSVYGGVHDNGFITPRSRGRSAIYRMARTPYSRIHPTASPKGHSSTYDGYGGSSAFPSTGFARELVARSVSKDLAPKRRSSVLEDEIGSVGPIRRLRQKTNLSTPKNMSFPVARTPYSSQGTGIPIGTSYDYNYKQKGPLTDACETSSSRRHDKIEENGPRNSNVSNGSLAPVETSNGTQGRRLMFFLGAQEVDVFFGCRWFQTKFSVSKKTKMMYYRS